MDPSQTFITAFFSGDRRPSSTAPRDPDTPLPPTKRGKYAPKKEVALQELGIYHIALERIGRIQTAPDLTSAIATMVTAYNQKKKKYLYQKIAPLQRIANAQRFHFECATYTQAVPIKSRVHSYLESLGGRNLETAKKVNYLFFFYRAQASSTDTPSSPLTERFDLFALTTGNAWRVVRSYTDFSFPQQIARRLLNPEMRSVVSERFLVGDTLSTERIARTVAASDRPLDSFITSMRCQLRPDASIFAFPFFQAPKTQAPLATDIEIGTGLVRICKQLSMSCYPFILDLFSQIVHREPTFCYTPKDPTEHRAEKDNPGFDFLSYFVPLEDPKQAKLLNECLYDMIWQAFTDQEELPLDFRHKYASSYSKASSFTLNFKHKTGLYTETWHVVKSATEMMHLLRRIPPLSEASRTDFFKELKKVKISFNSGGEEETAVFLDYLEGLVRDVGGTPFWRLQKRWYSVSVDYLGYIKEEFEKFLTTSQLPSRYLPELWPSPEEIAADKAANPHLKRDETEGKYNQKYLDLPQFVVGDKICPEGIELFDLFYYSQDERLLVQVKQGFGTSTRDACSQLRNAALYVHDALRRQGNTNKLGLFYDLATSTSSEANEDEEEDSYKARVKASLLAKFPTKEEFLQVFTEFPGRITFVYGIVDDAKEERPLRNEDNVAEAVIAEFSEEVLTHLREKGFIDAVGDLTDISQTISQKDFWQIWKGFGTRDQADKIHKLLKQHRSLAGSSKSTVARLEILHTAKELAKLDYGFKICQIRRSGYTEVPSDDISMAAEEETESPIEPQPAPTDDSETDSASSSDDSSSAEEELELSTTQATVELPCSENTQLSTLSEIGPLGLFNSGTTCFINAPFQLLMHYEPLRDALKQSCLTPLNTEREKAQLVLRCMNGYDKKDSRLRLESLRALIGNLQGQQDGLDLLRSVMNLIHSDKFPNCYFPLSMERRFMVYDPLQDGERGRKEQERLLKFISDGKSADPLPVNFQKRYPANLEYEISCPFFAGLKGEPLFRRCFDFYEADHDRFIFNDPATNQPTLYQIAQEKMIIERAPEFFILTFKRFDNQGRKISSPADLPFSLHIPSIEFTYQLSAILHHEGSSVAAGHYMAFVESQEQWWKCDDTRITSATEVELEHSRSQGYAFLFCKSSV